MDPHNKFSVADWLEGLEPMLQVIASTVTEPSRHVEFLIPRTAEFEEFRQRLAHEFRLQEGTDCVLKYEDDEGDFVTIAKPVDFFELKRCCGASLRVSVSFPFGMPASIADPPTQTCDQCVELEQEVQFLHESLENQAREFQLATSFRDARHEEAITECEAAAEKQALSHKTEFALAESQISALERQLRESVTELGKLRDDHLKREEVMQELHQEDLEKACRARDEYRTSLEQERFNWASEREQFDQERSNWASERELFDQERANWASERELFDQERADWALQSELFDRERAKMAEERDNWTTLLSNGLDMERSLEMDTVLVEYDPSPAASPRPEPLFEKTSRVEPSLTVEEAAGRLLATWRGHSVRASGILECLRVFKRYREFVHSAEALQPEHDLVCTATEWSEEVKQAGMKRTEALMQALFFVDGVHVVDIASKEAADAIRLRRRSLVQYVQGLLAELDTRAAKLRAEHEEKERARQAEAEKLSELQALLARDAEKALELRVAAGKRFEEELRVQEELRRMEEQREAEAEPAAHEDAVASLAAMGFELTRVEMALEAAGGRADVALNILLA